MSSRMFQNNGFLSILLMLFISFLFLLTIPGALCGNIAVNHVTYLSGPVSSPSQFGYSVVVQPQEEFLTFWVGAPKYSHGDSKSGSSGKPGALFRCVANKSAIKLSGNQPLNCLPIGLDSFENGKNNDQQTLSNSTAMSLDLNNCSFKNNDCQGFDILDYDDLRWRKTKRSGSSIPADKTKCIPKRHLPSNYRNRKSLRLTGPAQFTIDGPYLNVDSTKATIEGRVLHTELVSPLIEARKGYARCLRFCFNAYTVVLNAKRQLEVFVQYESANGSKIDDIKHTVFRFDSLKEKWSRLWNYTERNIVGLHDSTYRIYFKATVYPYAYPRNSCNYGAADIALSDIAITTSSCEEEVSNVDEITDEESIGMNLEYKTENKDMLSLASCGPLWQQNCGYSKEADGACYELLVNATHVMNMTSHKPLVRECIRGKMDIVLVVDQSGSVNHCNFQKVKRWLENIVRSFNIGENEQDIGVIVYSSTEKTNVVIPLGFNTHQVSGSNKKEETTKLLKKLSYAAGSTFTGYALKIANEELSRGRRDAKKVMILLTDGATTKENKNQLNEETAIARRRNTTILAIGVGRSNKTELVGIAGSENNIFSVRKFSELEKVRDSLRSSLKFETNEEGIKGENHSSSWPRQCQLGFSVHYTQKSMLMGSPGCYHRSGSVISYQSDPYTENEEKGSDSTFFNQSSQATTINPSSDVLSSTSAELNEARDLSKLSKLSNYDVPTLSQLQNLFSTEIFDSYIGYALTSGHFYGMDNPEYVAVSAPRYNMKGAVLIYHSLQGSAFKYHHLLNGQQLGEYFGATLCVTDLNADGFSDLLVGAPLHIGSHPDEGRVYVYLGGPKMSNEPDFVLTGSTSPFSRFGSYISAVGDLNNDNYNDIAVSAPLLGSGSVYIFYGSKDGIIPKHVQVINPTELYPLPDFVAKKFGKKVVGKVDIDNNSYPDLIVSSPENDALVVLLSRSVVNIDLQLHVPSEIDVQNDACRNYRSCFDISVCFSYNGSSIPSDIFIEFNLKVDFSQHQPRFTSSQNSSLSNVCSIIKLLSRNNFYCQNFPFVLKRRTRDLMSAISVTVEYDLKNDHPSSETDAVSEEDSASSYDYFSASGSPDNDVQEAVEDKFKLHPILSLNSVSTLEKVVYIQSYCNKLDECNADLVVNANVVNNFGEKVSEMSIDFEKIIRLRINVKNHGPEAAYDPAIIIYYSKFLFINSWKNIYSNLDNNETSSTQPCFEYDESYNDFNGFNWKSLKLLVKPTRMTKETSCDVEVMFGLASLDPYSVESLSFVVNGFSVSVDIDTSNNNAIIDLPVRYIGNLTFYGNPTMQLLMVETNSSFFPLKSVQEVQRNTQTLDQHFVVSNIGLIPLRFLQVEISWPLYLYMNESRFDLFYIKSINCSTTSKCICDSPEVIDPYEVTENSTFNLPTHAAQTPTQNISRYIQNCSIPSSNCYINITCNIQELRIYDSAFVSINFFAFPNTFAKLENLVHITTTASVRLKSNKLIDLSSANSFVSQIAVSVEPVSRTDFLHEVFVIYRFPWWIYLLCVAVGLFLVYLLYLLLRTLGWFENKYSKKLKAAKQKPEQYVPLQL